MSEPAEERGRWSFRLRGEVGGESRVIELPEGESSVGAAESNTIVVGLAAVSRRHAVLETRDGTVRVRDLGSKNGTFINGIRVGEGVLGAGDWVAFGPARFQLERIDPTDAQLAIALGDGDESGEVLTVTEVSTETGVHSEQHRPGAWMAAMSAVANNLLGELDPSPTTALADLATGIGSPGALFFRWRGTGEATVVSRWGDEITPDQWPRFGQAVQRGLDAAALGPVLLTGREREPASAVWALLARPGEPPWCFILLGGFPYWEQAEPFAEVVLRMLAHAQPEAIHVSLNGGRTEPPALVFPQGHVVGRSQAMATLYDELRLLVNGDLSVLVEGETGVGKEHVARTLHLSSPRSSRPFVAVNCAAIPAELLEAELFGIEKGVATGVTAREGKFRQANGGILVLDEIGELPLSLQPKLLRALQEREISPVGGRLPVKVDVRVIAMTNSDLAARVRDGKFRQDLYFRLNGYRLQVPPLRQRRADIPLLVESFLRRFAAEVGKPIRGLSVKALRALVQAPWEGNVRELEHVMRRLVYLCPEGATIDSSLLPGEVLHPTSPVDAKTAEVGADLDLEGQVEALERRLITIALARAKGNRSKAAKLLGISRNGLALKIERLGLE